MADSQGQAAVCTEGCRQVDSREAHLEGPAWAKALPSLAAPAAVRWDPGSGRMVRLLLAERLEALVLILDLVEELAVQR